MFTCIYMHLTLVSADYTSLLAWDTLHCFTGRVSQVLDWIGIYSRDLLWCDMVNAILSAWDTAVVA